MKHLVALLMTACVSGCYLLANKPATWPDDVDMRQNKAMFKQGTALRLAIVTYMAKHEDTAPEPAKWISALSVAPFLPNGHFPSNPWTTSRDVWDQEGLPQRNVVPVSACHALGTAYDDPTAIGTELGAGVMPGAGPAGCLTYGTFLFSATRGGMRWVLYGIGRHKNQAIVRYVATQAGSCCE